MVKGSRKKKVIGLLVSDIMDPFSIQLARGVSRAAKKFGVDVLIFPGKYIDRDLSEHPELMYEYQFTTLFTYANSDNIDGLIISANSIGCHCTEERMRQFVDGYGDIPCVLVATHFEGYTCVCYDNRNAVKDGINYLIKQEGCKHICLISGPEYNTDVIERKRAYIETLEENGLKFTDSMCEAGDFEKSEMSAKAMETLLRENPDMDAVFCLNDNMAMSAYDVLKKHGMVPGEEVKVFGYDNVQASGTMDPPLATVGADPILLGERSVECLIEKMDGKNFGNVTLPAKFIGRESLGHKYAEERLHMHSDEKTLRDDFSEIYYRYIYENREEDTEKVYQKFEVIMRAVLKSVTKQLNIDDTREEILKKFDDLVKSDALSYMDTEAMLRFIDRQGVRSTEVRALDPEQSRKSSALISEIYRHLVQAENKRYGAIIQKKQELDILMKNFVKDTMSFRHGNEQSYQVLLEDLDWAGITDGCIYIFENPVIHIEGEVYEPPKTAILRAYLRKGKVIIPPAGRQRRRIEDPFIPVEFGSDPYDMLVTPLFFSEEVYGLFLCNLSEILFTESEFIVSQLGAATRMLHILGENEGIQQQLEDHISVMSKMNIELDNLSRSDVLTGLFNRRGFMDSAVEFLELSKQQSQASVVGYVDMNNLKIVNDKFGHEEGDFSLKSIARILCEVLSGGKSIIGRIGGDEFAFIMKGSMRDAEKLDEAVKAAFAKFNKASDKPYNVTASVGMYPISEGEEISLEDALSYADEALYVAKQSKDRNVLKTV